ncbi:RNA polymerase sigma-70 factor [Paenibacillus sp. N4]|uniref:RNA polymerase sigma-70 factor n=1 Tax=Paenibacillus vietnamensis TaxID=2590547 RepID=UPI001CD05981|nr:RNA polymerase sigma-70 factor [Paenibacillus vietnamensis]MCA0756193.1 RNA polymerase sigma-70 factor [Paenibacillus vietnamensis]
MSYNALQDEWYSAYRALLFSLAYRMLGSVMDAEDIVQDAFVSLHAADPEAIRHPKAFLCKTVTNRCLDLLRSARRRREVYTGPWLPEPIVSGIGGDAGSDPMERYLQQETMSTAYVLLLQQLSASERAVYLLREALQYDYGDIADIVGKSAANCRQIYVRAKRSMQLAGAEREEPADGGASCAADGKLGRIVSQFTAALASGDMPKVLALLAEGAVLYSDGGGKVKAALRPIKGADRISAFLFGILAKLPEGYSFAPATVNGEAGVIAYQHGTVMQVVSFRQQDGRIDAVYLVSNPDKLGHLAADRPQSGGLNSEPD